jgi:hypothetical protein
MKAADKFIRKVVRAAKKSGTDLSTVIAYQNINRLLQVDENSPQGEFLNGMLSDQVSIFNKLCYLAYLGNEEDRLFPGLHTYLSHTKGNIESKIGRPIHESVDGLLKETHFKLSAQKRIQVHVLIQDCVFAKINEKTQSYDPLELQEIKKWMTRLLDKKGASQEAKLVAHEYEEIASASSITVNLGKTKIPMAINAEMMAIIRSKHEVHNAFIDHISLFTHWDPAKARKEYAAFLEDAASELKAIFNIQKSSLKKLFELLFEETKAKNKTGNKQQVFNFMYAVLEPFYSELQVKEEHDSLRGYSAHDAVTYRQYIRDSIRALIK